MITLRSIWSISWRSVLVALGYMTGLIMAGMVSVMIGPPMSANTSAGTNMTWLLISSILLGIFTGTLASRLTLTRFQHFVLWGSLIFFNLGSVAIEGKFFAPDLVPVPLSILFVQQLVASASAALMVMLLFASIGPSISWMSVLRTRPWHSGCGDLSPVHPVTCFSISSLGR